MERLDSIFFDVCERGNVEEVKLLYEEGADIESPGYSGLSPLNIASGEGNLEVVKFLIGGNAFIETVDNYGYTPLMNASKNGYSEVVKFLIEKGANISHRSLQKKIRLYLWLLFLEI